jgi:hypothetical protein
LQRLQLARTKLQISAPPPPIHRSVRVVGASIKQAPTRTGGFCAGEERPGVVLNNDTARRTGRGEGVRCLTPGTLHAEMQKTWAARRFGLYQRAAVYVISLRLALSENRTQGLTVAASPPSADARRPLPLSRIPQ